MAQPFDTDVLDVNGGPYGGLLFLFEKLRPSRFTVHETADLFPANPFFLIEAGCFPMVATVLLK